ncbi:MAG: hypothetical protein CMO55_12140 [Verrucomicrobiales bacterium]|nr:hypothetical protein [Verrucomicrobiales bacterium]
MSNDHRIADIRTEGTFPLESSATAANGNHLSESQRGEEVSFSSGDQLGPTGQLERIIDENDLLPVAFLESGASRQRSIARVTLREPHRGLNAGSGWGTGFLVSPSLFLTNNHVIREAGFLRKIRFEFNYQVTLDGFETIPESYLAAADGFLHTNVDLDYTLVRLNPGPIQNDGTPIPPGNRWGSIQLEPFVQFREEQHFNIIQHPNGRRKEVALQDNEIAKLFRNIVLYKGDTEPGSSGSPVFDNVWQLVALHHAGGETNAEGDFVNNEGIRIDRIVEDLRETFQNSSEILTELGIA